MENVCPKCHKVHEDMKDKFCSNCGTKLITREKRKPIPPELRHQILVRDGYRCRECGKSNKETSLEIDHIHPLSKGGPTTEDNLWVLCRECNQAKKDDEWKDDEIEVTRNELANLENQLTEAKVKLQDSTDEDEIRDYKFKIKKFETEYIPQVTNKLNTLIKEEKELELKRRKQQEENIRREKLFKDLYIDLEGELLSELCDYYSLTESSNEDNLRILVDMHSEKEIYERIDIIKKELKEEAIRKELYDKLYNTMSDDELKLFINEFSMKGTKEEILNELVNLFSEDEIELLKIKLIKKEEDRLKAERLALYNRVSEQIDYKLLRLFATEFSIDNSRSIVVNYLIDNYSEDEINSMKDDLLEKEELRQQEIRREFYENVCELLDDHDIELFSMEKDLANSKPTVVEYLIDNYSMKEIKKQLSELHIKESKELLYSKLMNSLNRIDFIMLHKNNPLLKKYNTREKLLKHLVESHSENEINELLSSNRDSFNQNKNVSEKYLDTNTNEGFSSSIARYYGFKEENKKYVMKTLINNFTYTEIRFMVKECRENIGILRSSNNKNLGQDIVRNHLLKVESVFMPDFVYDIINTQPIELHIKEPKETLYSKLMNSLDRIDFIMLHKNNPLIRKYNTREKLLKHLVESHSENGINELLSSNRDSFNQNKNVSEKYLNTNINERFSSSIARYYGFKEENKKYVMETLINNFTYAEIRFMVKDCRENIGILRSSNKKNLDQDIVKNHLLKVESVFMPDFVYDIINTL